MPKRKRNRRNRRGRTKKPENGLNGVNASSPMEAVLTCFDTSPEENNAPIFHQLETEKSTPSPENLVFVQNDTPITTTPVNRKRSMNKARTSYGSMNVTNLNILFDSKFIYNSPTSETSLCKGDKGVASLKRSKSSIPKLHSPGKEKPLSIHRSTQTILDDLATKYIQTPKASKVLLKDGSPVENSFSLLNNHFDDHGGKKFNTTFDNDFNVNPYLNKEAKIFNRDGGVGDFSFFSPNLFQHKLSSTPINNVNKRSENAENVIDYSLNTSFISKVDFSMNVKSPVTPKFASSLNINNVAFSEKIVNKENENSLKSLKMHSLHQSRRRSCRTSPNSPIHHSLAKISNRNVVMYSRLNVSRRSSLDLSFDNLHRAGTCERLFMHLKKYCKVSQTWSTKVLNVCTQLGTTLKNSLSSLCTVYNENSMLENVDPKICKCEELRQEICHLNLKIETLTKDVGLVNAQMLAQQHYRENMGQLTEELRKVKEELSQFKDMRTELQTLRDQFKCIQGASKTAACASFPPPPPPPPLPPPPPPMMPDFLTSLLPSKREMTRKRVGSEGSIKSRPVISLDDILRVKLKKPSNRTNQTPTSGNLTQPLVSDEMLRQVKLKPRSRGSVQYNTPENLASELSTSPHSSLCRLLVKNDPGFRVKRLRKVGGYSYDSVYRRNSLAKRDRESS